MKIKSIQMKNIGSYANDNTFDFDTNRRRRRMVLIGGKNGTGKTTLFNAIKLCLYGCIAYGYESNNTKYYEEISKVINSSEMNKKSGEAKIVIEILWDDGKYNYIYTFNRSWRISPKKIVESFDLYKDNIMLSETEKENFENYLIQILPPDLFKFYFFDGEKISNFVFNNSKNSDFKDALLKICSLDTMEIIRENFRRIIKNRVKDDDKISQAYEVCLEKDKSLETQIVQKEDEYKVINNEIVKIDDSLFALEKSYSKGGGISKKSLQSMLEQLTKEEMKRKETRKWLKDVANNVLPFIILRQQLGELKEQVVLEQKSQVYQSVKNTVNTQEIKTIISSTISKAGVEFSEDLSEKIVCEICDFVNISDTKTLLNLSEHDQYELIAQINSLISFDIKRIKKATDEIEESLKSSGQIRKKMERSSTHDYEDYLKKKSDLNELRSQKSQKLLEINEDLQSLREQKSDSALQLAKIKKDYENVLKQISVNDISARALLAFDELQGILYEKSVCSVENEFKKCFKALINKSDLIEGIHIDDNLNVLPYKNKKFRILDLKETAAKNGEAFLIDQIGFHAYEILKEKMDTKGDIVLPVEVKQTLSAGEKQVFIMALYQALSRLNKMDVPYIVDTPFARIDKDHRSNILEQFFKKLKGQIIILSTDEEVVGKYYTAISDMVSDTFILKHKEDGTTEILDHTYFGD